MESSQENQDPSSRSYAVYRVREVQYLGEIWQYLKQRDIDIIFTEYQGVRGLYSSVSEGHIELGFLESFGEYVSIVCRGHNVHIDLLNTHILHSNSRRNQGR